MNAEIDFEPYEVHGRREWMMRVGGKQPLNIIVLLPFFHEGNRLRAIAAGIMRALAERGIGSVLPDLPGCGDSLSPLPDDLAFWRDAAAGAARATNALSTLAIRSGALLDDLAPPGCRWRLSPATGAALTRDLVRSRVVEARDAGREENVEGVAARARSETTRLAGYSMPAGLFHTLEGAVPDPTAARTIRLAGDARPADRRVAGALAWRQSEPLYDGEFVSTIAKDFSDWVATFAGF